jgi:hypothetical protein
VQTGQQDLEGLLEHLQRTTSIGPGEARRVVEDVLAWFSESTEAYVRRRHRELRAQGVANPDAFAVIARELTTRRVAAPALSLRQIRRVIYG